ncbi:MAG: Sec-independent protein translocase protein TatB [Pseudomonadales bacterium]|nr:twin-arginine translocase subunit TatB [Pseudomonadales bacterium]
MFDIGFPELVLVAIVGLLVIGPERLPEALRTLGLWFGRMRRSFTAVKAEIEKEIGMDEVKRQLHNEAIMDEMKRIESEVRSTATSAKKSIGTSLDSVGSSIDAARKPPARSGSDTAHQDAAEADTDAALPPAETPVSDEQVNATGPGSGNSIQPPGDSSKVNRG